MEWRFFTVDLIPDESSQVGMKEELTQIAVNETIPSYTQTLLTVPKLTLDPGLYKIVFHFEVSN